MKRVCALCMVAMLIVSGAPGALADSYTIETIDASQPATVQQPAQTTQTKESTIVVEHQGAVSTSNNAGQGDASSENVGDGWYDYQWENRPYYRVSFYDQYGVLLGGADVRAYDYLYEPDSSILYEEGQIFLFWYNELQEFLMPYEFGTSVDKDMNLFPYFAPEQFNMPAGFEVTEEMRVQMIDAVVSEGRLTRDVLPQLAPSPETLLELVMEPAPELEPVELEQAGQPPEQVMTDSQANDLIADIMGGASASETHEDSSSMQSDLVVVEGPQTQPDEVMSNQQAMDLIADIIGSSQESGVADQDAKTQADATPPASNGGSITSPEQADNLITKIIENMGRTEGPPAEVTEIPEEEPPAEVTEVHEEEPPAEVMEVPGEEPLTGGEESVVDEGNSIFLGEEAIEETTTDGETPPAEDIAEEESLEEAELDEEAADERSEDVASEPTGDDEAEVIEVAADAETTETDEDALLEEEDESDESDNLEVTAEAEEAAGDESDEASVSGDEVLTLESLEAETEDVETDEDAEDTGEDEGTVVAPVYEEVTSEVTFTLYAVREGQTIPHGEKIYPGDTIVLEGYPQNPEDRNYRLQWQSNAGNGWEALEGANGREYSFILTENNFDWRFKLEMHMDMAPLAVAAEDETDGEEVTVLEEDVVIEYIAAAEDPGAVVIE